MGAVVAAVGDLQPFDRDLVAHSLGQQLLVEVHQELLVGQRGVGKLGYDISIGHSHVEQGQNESLHPRVTDYVQLQAAMSVQLEAIGSVDSTHEEIVEDDHQGAHHGKLLEDPCIAE